MAGPVQTLHFGVIDSAGVPGITKVTPNLRVKTGTGFLGTVADTVLFPGPSPVTPNAFGLWVTPNQRCLAGGIPIISVSSVGISYTPVPLPTGPMTVIQPDPRVSAM